MAKVIEEIACPYVYLLILVLSLATACGFQLRGSQPSELPVSNIYLDNQGATQLTEQVRLQLEAAGATITKTQQQADYIVALKEERFERSVLSVSATTGKVEEYLITYTVKMDVWQGDGRELTSNASITVSRDYAFDEGAVLGKYSEEVVIKEDLVYRASSQIFRRLQALITNSR